MSIWRHLRAIALLPATVTILVPASLLYLGGGADIGGIVPAPWSALPALAGCILVGLGFALWARTTLLLARMGQGTLSPWDPTRRLVAHGPYRYVRNPMISGVFLVLLGEAVFFGSAVLLLWFLLFVALNLVYIPLWEEPDLERRLGPSYFAYKRSVPRWVPRFAPPEETPGGQPGSA